MSMMLEESLRMQLMAFSFSVAKLLMSHQCMKEALSPDSISPC